MWSHHAYKLHFIGEVMSFHIIDEHTMTARRNVHIKDRLGFRERSRKVIRKRRLPPKRKVREFSLGFTNF